MSDKKWSLGKRPIAVSISDFNGDLKFHIRYMQTIDNVQRPTKKGITLNPEEWDALCNFSFEINNELNRLRAEKRRAAELSRTANEFDIPRSSDYNTFKTF